MIVLHAHWQPPQRSDDTGSLALWAETAEAPQPARRRGRLPSRPKPQPHPFCLDAEDLRQGMSVFGWSLGHGSQADITLRLPSTRSGPQPSPSLWHTWEQDNKTPPFLAPWQISSLALHPVDSLDFLLALPSDSDLPASLRLGPDLLFWQVAASLALETLAQHKYTPIIAQTAEGFHARWLPVFDGPKDGPRLAQLGEAMPPLCRADATVAELPSPRRLLDSFLHLTVDAAGLRQRRSGELDLEEEMEELEEAVVLPLEAGLDTFWVLGTPLDDLAISIKAPAITMPLLKRLGEPAFLSNRSLQELLGPAYTAISQEAIAAAFGNDEEVMGSE